MRIPHTGDTQRVEAGSPALPRARVLPVEAVGCCDALGGTPYRDLLWFEGRRPELPWPSALWAFDAAGIVAEPIDDSPQAQQAAAVAIDAVRASLALRLPGEQDASRVPLGSSPELRAVLHAAVARADGVLQNWMAASRDPRATAHCGLLIAAAYHNRLGVALRGRGRAYLVREGECSALCEDEGDAPEADGRVAYHEADLEAGDVAVLMCAAAGDAMYGPEQVARAVAESASLEAACQQLVVQAKGRGAVGRLSVVMLAVDPERSGIDVRSSRSSPLGFVLALRAAALPEAEDDPDLGVIDALLRQLPAARTRADSGVTPEVAPAPTPPPVGAEPAVAAPQPTVYTPPRRRGLPWGALALLALVAAGLLVAYRPPALVHDLLGRSADQPVGPIPAPGPTAIPEAPAPTQDCEVRFSVGDAELNASLASTAGYRVEAIVHEVANRDFRELSRVALQPGDMSQVASGEVAQALGLRVGDSFVLRFDVQGDGSVAWAKTARLSDLPEHATVSIGGPCLYVTDRRSNIVLVVKAATPVAGRDGPRLPQVLYPF